MAPGGVRGSSKVVPICNLQVPARLRSTDWITIRHLDFDVIDLKIRRGVSAIRNPFMPTTWPDIPPIENEVTLPRWWGVRHMRPAPPLLRRS